MKISHVMKAEILSAVAAIGKDDIEERVVTESRDRKSKANRLISAICRRMRREKGRS